MSNHPSPKPSAPAIILKIKVPQSRHKDYNGLPLFQVSSPGANSNSTRAVSSPTKPFSKVSSGTVSVSSERPHKRTRASRMDDAESSYSADTPDYATKPPHSTAPKAEPCVLMQWALRNQAAPNARKTQRLVTAFGTKVPQSLEEVRDFELPEWIRPRSPTTVVDGSKELDVPSAPLPGHSSDPASHATQTSSPS
ncbi:hypothetical protein JVU11DRAFT_4884 [Chiua virens]|nr:hypothetical protein JVU11DRAFT_4884 [Chiua virens]